MFMVRLKLPGGKLTADQYLAMDDICRDVRQRHAAHHDAAEHPVPRRPEGEPEGDDRGHQRRRCVTTLGGCGDVNRNVMACPAPLPDAARKLNMELCDAVAAALAPKAGMQAYHEIWLNGEKQPTPATKPDEPIYGKIYLPRKFKIAFALPDDNCIDIFANCLGFWRSSRTASRSATTSSSAAAWADEQQARHLPAARAADLLRRPDRKSSTAAEAVVKLFRDHGNRGDRKRARLKYVVHDWGVEKFREVFDRDYFKHTAARAEDAADHRPRPAPRLARQGDGKWFLGV